MLNKMQMNAS